MIALRHIKPLLSAALLALALLPTAGRAQDAARLPDWKGQWIRLGPPILFSTRTRNRAPDRVTMPAVPSGCEIL